MFLTHPRFLAAYERFNERFSDFSEDTGELGKEWHYLLDTLLAELVFADYIELGYPEERPKIEVT